MPCQDGYGLELPIFSGILEAALTVQSTLKRVPGVLEAEANATTGSILVHYDSKIIVGPR